MPPTFSFSQDSAATARSSRHRPLHACGVSLFAIAGIAFGKTQDINGPLGSTCRKMAKLAKFLTPVIYAIQYQWLAILSFIDDHILALEKITEKLFPPSTFVFDKIDHLVLVIISLPEKFDGAVNKFPAIIHQVPFIEWALSHVISRLKGLISMLNHWGIENSRVNEKTIGVDRDCDEEQNASKDITNENIEDFPSISEVYEAENKGVENVAVLSHKKGTYKEALERRKEENNPCEDDEKKMETKEWQSEEKKIDGIECDDEGDQRKDGNEENEILLKYPVGTSSQSNSIKGDEELLDLFDSVWLMKPGHSFITRE